MGRSCGPKGPPPALRSFCRSASTSFTPTSAPNRPMNMLPFTKAPRLPNMGLTSTRVSAGTRDWKRALSASLGLGIFMRLGPRAQSRHTLPRQVADGRLAAGHGHDQRRDRSLHLGAIAARPVDVGSPQPQAGDSVLGADDEVRALVEVGDPHHRVLGVVVGDAEGTPD